MPKMDDGKLKAIIEAKVVNALGYQGGRLASDRMQAMRYYRGEPFGNEIDGRSQVVSRDVAEAVDSMLPSLVRMFTAGDRVVEFMPTRPQEEALAAQATDYVNWIWNSQNPGFRTFYTWFKDALLQKVGVIKIWWDATPTVTTESYQGLTDQELDLLLDDDDVEPIEYTRYPDPHPAPLVPPLVSAAPLPAVVSAVAAALEAGGAGDGGSGFPPGAAPPVAYLHDVRVRVTNREGRVVICPVPPEEFLIDRRAVSLEEAPFVAHRVRRTLSELIEQGYPKSLVSTIEADADVEFSQERIERFRDEDEMPWRGASALDPSMREIWLTECYLKVDCDGDGIAEMRKITVAGSTGVVILDNEEIDEHPFAALTPILMPHKFFGQSVADQVMDLQLIKSTLLRQMLDNLYLTNNPEKEVVEGQVNLDDLLTSRPGGLKRVKQPGSINVLETPFVAGATFPMLDYIDTAREQRTGVTRYNQGLDADTLNKTATGVNLIANAGMQRLELTARLFAETGVAQAFRRILQLVCQYQQKPRIVKLRGSWVPIDPREWSSEYDLSIAVGLGTGTKQQQIDQLTALFGLDQQIMMAQGGANGPLLTWSNLHAQLGKLIEAFGLKTPDRYFTDPSTVPPPPPAPPPVDPNAALGEAALAKARVDIQIAKAKAVADIEVMKAKAQADLALNHQKAHADAALKVREARAEAALNHRKAQTEASLNVRKAREEARHRKAKSMTEAPVADTPTAKNAADKSDCGCDDV